MGFGRWGVCRSVQLWCCSVWWGVSVASKQGSSGLVLLLAGFVPIVWAGVFGDAVVVVSVMFLLFCAPVVPPSVVVEDEPACCHCDALSVSTVMGPL